MQSSVKRIVYWTLSLEYLRILDKNVKPFLHFELTSAEADIYVSAERYTISKPISEEE